MKYMLDTDITSCLIKPNHPYKKRLVERLLSHDASEVCISSINLCEIVSGLEKISSHNELYRRKIKNALTHFLTAINILDYIEAYAWKYGEIRARLITKGQDIGAMDCLIASHAVVENLTLVTNNLKHFARIEELKLENWITEVEKETII